MRGAPATTAWVSGRLRVEHPQRVRLDLLAVVGGQVADALAQPGRERVDVGGRGPSGVPIELTTRRHRRRPERAEVVGAERR